MPCDDCGETAADDYAANPNIPYSLQGQKLLRDCATSPFPSSHSTVLRVSRTEEEEEKEEEEEEKGSSLLLQTSGDFVLSPSSLLASPMSSSTLPPPPPYLPARFRPTLGKLHEKIAALEAIIRRHVPVETLSNISTSEDEFHTSFLGNDEKSDITVSTINEVLNKQLDRILDDPLVDLSPISIPLPKFDEDGSDDLELLLSASIRAGASLRGDTPDASVLDKLLDLKSVNQQPHNSGENPGMVRHLDPLVTPSLASPTNIAMPASNMQPIVLTPTSSDCSLSVSTDDTLLVVVKHGTTNPDEANRHHKKIMHFMCGTLESMSQLCGVIQTRVEGMQRDLDAFHTRCVDCINRADLTGWQYRHDDVVKRLCSQTDRYHIFRRLIQQEREKMREVIHHSERSESPSNPLYSPSCVCYSAPLLRDRYLLATSVLSYRRQLSRLVELFCASDVALEQWGKLLEEEANTKIPQALEEIFRESVREKESLLQIFEIISKEDL